MNLTIFSINADFYSIDKCIKNIPVFISSNNQDIALALFEVLANVVEHSIYRQDKNDIFAGKIKKSYKKINLAFYLQNNRLEIIIHHNQTTFIKKSSSLFGRNGKKIIKYLCQNHSYAILGNTAYEKISFCLNQMEQQ